MKLEIKVLWLENYLGLAIDEVNSNIVTQLTPYYFWPKTDAWEQLKNELNSKLWIEEREKIILLNDVSQIMNHWQKNRKEQSFKSVKDQYKKIKFIGGL